MTTHIEIVLPCLIALSNFVLKTLHTKSDAGEIDFSRAALVAEHLLNGFQRMFPDSTHLQARTDLSDPQQSIYDCVLDFCQFAKTAKADNFRELTEDDLGFILPAFVATDSIQILVCLCHLGKTYEDIAKLWTIVHSHLSSLTIVGD